MALANNKMSITIVVAMAKNRVIGKKGELPWYISEDLKRFKKLTLNKSVLMGRITYDSIVKRIGKGLPERENLILTKQNYPDNIETNVHFFNNIEQVFSWMKSKKQKELIVAGGTSLYEKLLPIASKLEVTHVNKNFEGDTVFPCWERNLWRATNGEMRRDETSGLEYFFSTYDRI